LKFLSDSTEFLIDSITNKHAHQKEIVDMTKSEASSRKESHDDDAYMNPHSALFLPGPNAPYATMITS
jgi:hypothetical protein